jgi:hypothetical protein
VAIRARDGEFQRFILDKDGRLGHQEPTSYPALLARLTHDVSRAKSCCFAWERAEATDIHERYASGPLVNLLDFQNNVAILRSNSNYSRRDIVGTLSGLTFLDARPSQHDTEIIRQSNAIVTVISESILAMENLITHLDATISHSCSEYQRACKASDSPLDKDLAPVVFLDGEGEGEVREEGAMTGRARNLKRITLTHVPDDNIIDISDSDSE